MAEHRFVIVTFISADNDYAEIAMPTLNKATDWLRFARNNWLVWTSSSPDRWYARLKPLLKRGDNVLICEVDMSSVRAKCQRHFGIL
jgi:hypothetical protein